ncbi:MAG: hypothetical protein K5905_17140 [Roseibium sp.]|nr:hypothetical protein [Roseibium sp.]
MPIIAEGQRLLLGYNGSHDLYAVCEEAPKILTEISENGAFATFLTSAVSEHYFRGLKKGFHPLEFNPTYEYINELRPSLKQSAAQMLSDLRLNEEEQDWMRRRYEATINDGMALLFGFEACLRTPESLRNGQYAAWNQSVQQQSSRVDETELELIQLQEQSRRLNDAGRFRILSWPYIIVFALALKFGKGVAAVKQRQ